jgi:hypothetical protein
MRDSRDGEYDAITDSIDSSKDLLGRLLTRASGRQDDRNSEAREASSLGRRNVLKLLTATAGAAVVGTGRAGASDGPRHLQVPRPADLCGTVPGDHHLALIERESHTRGKGFYAGGAGEKWHFGGWLAQSEPSDTAEGSVSPDDDATEPAHRLIQVARPSDLTNYRPGDQHFAFIEDESHARGRGFYAGGTDGTWYFVGWLAQSEPSGTTSGSLSPKKNSTEPEERLLQVRKPKKLEKYDPTDHSLAFIEDESHAKGRGFYAGGADGTWYFIGWLAQSEPSGTAGDTVDLTADDCGSDGSGTDDSDDSEDSDDSDDSGASPVTDTDTLSNGAWYWWAEEVESYEPWLGEGTPVAATGHGKNTWDNFIDFDTRDFPSWVENGSDRTLVPHIPMLPREEIDAVGRATALRDLADGEYDEKFRSMAEGFRDDGFTTESLVLRVGNEFNIEAQPYSPVGTDVSASTWVEGYRRIVDICRDVLGEGLETVWAPLVHSTQMSTAEVLDHYPGADYAMVGADIYDSAPPYEKSARAPDGVEYDTADTEDRRTVQEHVWTETHLNGRKWDADGVGLDDIAGLAEDVGAAIAIPEWGLSHDGYEWGGDVNPTFVRNMYDWIDDHDVAFHAYFEHDTEQVDHALGDGGAFDFEAAETTYVGAFGDGELNELNEGGDDGDDPTTGTNYVFVTEEELRAQQQLVEDGREPWKSAHDNLVADADRYLDTTLRSVTDENGSHYFNGDDYAHDYPAAIDMSEWARDCALAYWFTGEDRYARRAVEVIHHWCLKDSTYMHPTVEIEGKSGSIEQFITIPAFAYAASLLRGHPAWDDYDGSRPWDGGSSDGAEAAFQRWVADRGETYVESRPNYCVSNNKWAWRITDRAVTAAYLQDDAKMDEAKCMWKGKCATCDGKNRPWNDFVNNYRDSRASDGTADPDNNGLFKAELNRNAGFTYSAYNLKALTLALAVFERYDGTELYDYNAPSDNKSGSTLGKAFEWMDDYTQDTGAWKWNDGVNIDGTAVEESTSAFELAYAYWGDFDGAVESPDKVSRPHYDSRLLGHVTLTHGAE